MKKLGLIASPAVLAFCLAGAGTGAFAADKAGAIPFTTPAGITMVDVVKTIGNAANQFMWRRLGDANGKPLYTSNADAAAGGKPTCYDECTKDFVAFVAPAGAKAFGDWTIAARTDGVKQWAYQGLPLYSYTGKDPLGEPQNNGGLSTTGAENPANMDPGSKVFSPKEGWKRAAYTPSNTFPTPSGIDLKSLATANGYGLVDSTTKNVAYVIKTAPKNPTQWTPMYAPSMAVPMGDFTILAREDGTKQWAFKGQRLYTFTGDYSPSDKNGTLAEKDAQVALVYQHFMPASLEINVYPGRGPLLVNKEGLSLYTQSRQQLQYGGRETRDGYRYNYSSAKAVGAKGCVDDCTKTWKPLLASANAQAQGFWEVVSRADGTKQWSYKGSALYTYVDDKKPGDIEGNNRHIIMFGDAEGKVDISVSGGDELNSKWSTGSGLYWHLAGLFN